MAALAIAGLAGFVGGAVVARWRARARPESRIERLVRLFETEYEHVTFGSDVSCSLEHFRRVFDTWVHALGQSLPADDEPLMWAAFARRGVLVDGDAVRGLELAVDLPDVPGPLVAKFLRDPEAVRLGPRHMCRHRDFAAAFRAYGAAKGIPVANNPRTSSRAFVEARILRRVDPCPRDDMLYGIDVIPRA